MHKMRERFEIAREAVAVSPDPQYKTQLRAKARREARHLRHGTFFFVANLGQTSQRREIDHDHDTDPDSYSLCGFAIEAWVTFGG
jgi:hypothetical protein